MWQINYVKTTCRNESVGRTDESSEITSPIPLPTTPHVNQHLVDPFLIPTSVKKKNQWSLHTHTYGSSLRLSEAVKR